MSHPLRSPLTAALSPMEALAVLYGDGQEDAARAILEGLGWQIFEGDARKPLTGPRKWATGFVFRLMERTTWREAGKGPDGNEFSRYRNRILERSGHPYTTTLLQPTRADTSYLVEGGDPMNAIYMLLCPDVARNARLWDLLLLDSVPSRDVQVRFAWETRLLHDLASRRLRRGEPVRIKAFAAGTGLSVIVACEQLLRDGHDPRLIRAVISDRDPSHKKKTIQLLEKLPLLRDQIDRADGAPSGILAQTEDIFRPVPGTDREFDVVTAVGILEYFTGHTSSTTEDRLGEALLSGGPCAEDLLRAVANVTAAGGHLIVNSHRESAATRILEVFGKRFRYRNLENLRKLAAAAGFVPAGTPFSGNVYDVAVFKKPTLEPSLDRPYC